MKKDLKLAPQSGSIRVAFTVSQDVASRIQQSVVNSWQKMQDLGVVSVQLDNEQLMSNAYELHNKLPKTDSIELQSCSQLSYPFNGHTEFIRVLDSCRGTRGRKRGRQLGSRVTKRKCNDGPMYQTSNDKLSSSTFSVGSVAPGAMASRIGFDTSQKIEEVQDVASLYSSNHVLSTPVQRFSSSSLLPHPTNTAFSGTALGMVSHSLTERPHFTSDVLQVRPADVGGSVAANSSQSCDLPPPSTPYVPKCRKRRKVVDCSSETVVAKSLPYTMLSCTEPLALPVYVNSSVEAASKLCWPHYTNKRFPLNGYYSPQLQSPVCSQHTVNNVRLLPACYASPRSPVASAEYANAPLEREMVLDCNLKSVGFLPKSTALQLENTDTASMKRYVPDNSSHLLHSVLGSNVVHCHAKNQHELLRQLVVPASSEACSPKLSNDLSPGCVKLRYHNLERDMAFAGVTMDSESDCAEHFCSSVNSRLCDALSMLSTERHLCSRIGNSDSAYEFQPLETSLSSEVNNESLLPVLKSSETIGASSLVGVTENIHCCAISTTSVFSSSNSAHVVEAGKLDRNLPMFSSAAVKKHNADVVNGYHLMSDHFHQDVWQTSHKLVSSTITKTSCLPNAVNDNIDNMNDIQLAADSSPVTEPASNGKASRTTNTLHTANVLVSSISNNNWTVSGICATFLSVCWEQAAMGHW